MAVNKYIEGGGGGGGTLGPASSSDNAVARWNGPDGDRLQDSGVTISDANVVSGATQINVDNLRLDGNTLSSTNTNGNVTLDMDGTGYVDVQGRVALSGGPSISGSGSTLTIHESPTSANRGALVVSSVSTYGDERIINGTSYIETGNVAQIVTSHNSELLTLSTGGATTDTVGNLLPANSVILSVVARVTTTITTATDWKLGDGTTADRFTSANATMTAGTTDVGLRQWDGTGATGPIQSAAAKVRVTTTGTPGAGAVRITVFYRQFVPPTS